MTVNMPDTIFHEYVTDVSINFVHSQIMLVPNMEYIFRGIF
jgi:hypothetical protein